MIVLFCLHVQFEFLRSDFWLANGVFCVRAVVCEAQVRCVFLPFGFGKKLPPRRKRVEANTNGRVGKENNSRILRNAVFNNVVLGAVYLQKICRRSKAIKKSIHYSAFYCLIVNKC